MRKEDVGTSYTIEVWALQYGKETWMETRYENLPSEAAAQQIIKDRFADSETQVAEYTTTRRVLD